MTHVEHTDRGAHFGIAVDPADRVSQADRVGDWILTATGKQAYPLDLRKGEVCIEDIAHSLGNTCRYAGHCEDFFSVGQHSVLVSLLVERQEIAELALRDRSLLVLFMRATFWLAWSAWPGGLWLWSVYLSLFVYPDGKPPAAPYIALLHDRAEAYLGDMVRPLKKDPSMAGYADAERHVELVTAQAFHIPAGMPDYVKKADNVLLATEKRDLTCAVLQGAWRVPEEPAPWKVRPWSPRKSRRAFMRRYNLLRKAVG